MHYAGVVPLQGYLQLAVLEEVRATEPPIRLSALFFEPGAAEQVAAEIQSLGEVVVALGAPLTVHGDGSRRTADALLAARGVPPQAPNSEVSRLAAMLAGMAAFRPEGEEGESGPVAEGAYRSHPLFETNPDGVFYALQGRRLPAKRHPLGMQLRIDELAGDHVIDDGGDLWHRRMEELDAAACALCAHRYAVGHASWVGAAGDGAIVLPGSSLPNEFARAGVVPPVERLQLPPVTHA
jgi:predicted nuclease with RNAse H fold